MSGRALLNTVHTMLLEQYGAEKVDEILHGQRRWRETIPDDDLTWEEVA